MHPELDRLLEPAFVEDLTALDLAEVRRRRAACQQREESVSYLRRVIQVRLDLLGTELSRRHSGDAPGDMDELLARLPAILAEHSRAPGMGQAPRDLRLPAIDDELTDLVDGIISPRRLSELNQIPDAELVEAVDRMEGLEQEVSGVRRRLHAQIDQLQAEITRRYRSGEASVDALLQ
ncbi:MAG: hypothetical protein U5K29_12390 [Acidimicrobiales bacterium]|nr:hypothetical protein [Acidimicrobiales bacterium]